MLGKVRMPHWTLQSYMLHNCMHSCDMSTADGVVSYSMQQGDMRGNDLQLTDLHYDGTNYDGHLVGGLGQLADLEEGVTNFRLDDDNTGHKVCLVLS